MSEYIKHTWEDGEVIDAPKLNNIETGITEAKNEAAQVKLAANNAQKAAENAATAAEGALKAAENADNAAKNAASEAQANLNSHNTNTESHADLRLELQELANWVKDLLDSDDETLNEMHEVVAYIKSNKSLIDAITISKVNVSDIVNDLVTNVTNKPVSAAQAVVLKGLIDAVTTIANNAATAAANAQATANSKAPAYTSGTTDLTAGSSPLTTGSLHFVYE